MKHVMQVYNHVQVSLMSDMLQQSKFTLPIIGPGGRGGGGLGKDINFFINFKTKKLHCM